MTPDAPPEFTYQTPVASGEARLTDRGSKFLGLCAPAVDEAAALAILEERSRLYHDATHHCWAFRVGDPLRPQERSADAGEPSGTAGRPILDQIHKAELVGVMVIVTRWFGGVKLGKGGLVRAYSKCAAAAVEAACVERRRPLKRLKITCDYDQIGLAEKLAARFEGKIIEGIYETQACLVIELPAIRIEPLLVVLREDSGGRIRAVIASEQ